MITKEKPARLLIRRAPANTLAAPLLQAAFSCFHASQTELSKGAQLAFGPHDDAIQAYGRAVFDRSPGKVTLMNSRKQRSASTHGGAFADNHSEEH
jgi:hypothetical protein